MYFLRGCCIAAVVGLASPSASQSQETLICLADLSTGFRLENGNWTITQFNTGNQRFLVSPIKDQDPLKASFNYTVTRIGDAAPRYYCSRIVNQTQMVCGGMGWGFVVNFSTLRFQDIYGIGFLDGTDQPGNTPGMTIGKCSRVG